MGAGIGKLLPYLDIGPEIPEDKIKKAYARVLTTGLEPKKKELVWKCLNISMLDATLNTEELVEASEFIHEGRVKRKNTIILIQQDQSNAAVFAASYFMILGGLTPEAANLAFCNAIKATELKIKENFMGHLQALSERYTPVQLRDRLFKNAGTLPDSQLTEDVSKLYELCGLPRPTMEQVKLKAAPPPLSISPTATSPRSTAAVNFFKGRRASKDEVKGATDVAKSPSYEDKTKYLSSGSEAMEVCIEEAKPPSLVEAMTDSNLSEVCEQKNDVMDVNNEYKQVDAVDLAGDYLEPSAAPTQLTESTFHASVDNSGVLLHLESSGDLKVNETAQKLEVSSKSVTDAVLLATSAEAEGNRTEEHTVNNAASQNGIVSPEPTGRKIKIVRSKATELTSPTNNVDEYLSHTSEDQRKEHRKRISIVRSGTREETTTH